MFITIINDCTDANVIGRQGTRVASLFGLAPTYVGVGDTLRSENHHDPAEYEAAGCLVDVIDAGLKEKGVVLVNVANRHKKGKRWTNGTPFAYFYVGETLVASTIDGYTLSLVKKLRITNEVNLVDIPTVLTKLVNERVVTEDLKEHIVHTQFRSLEFLPRVAKWLTDGLYIPSTTYAINQIPDIPQAIWYADNFGNCKTTILPEEIGFEHGKAIHTKFGLFRCYNRLKDLPNGETALIIGSSGYKEKRFLEFVVQGQSAAEIYNLSPGSSLF